MVGWGEVGVERGERWRERDGVESGVGKGRQRWCKWWWVCGWWTNRGGKLGMRGLCGQFEVFDSGDRLIDSGPGAREGGAQRLSRTLQPVARSTQRWVVHRTQRPIMSAVPSGLSGLRTVRNPTTQQPKRAQSSTRLLLKKTAPRPDSGPHHVTIPLRGNSPLLPSLPCLSSLLRIQ